MSNYRKCAHCLPGGGEKNGVCRFMFPLTVHSILNVESSNWSPFVHKHSILIMNCKIFDHRSFNSLGSENKAKNGPKFDMRFFVQIISMFKFPLIGLKCTKISLF